MVKRFDKLIKRDGVFQAASQSRGGTRLRSRSMSDEEIRTDRSSNTSLNSCSSNIMKIVKTPNLMKSEYECSNAEKVINDCPETNKPLLLSLLRAVFADIIEAPSSTSLR